MATLDKVSLNIAVVLGTTSMPVHQVLRLGRGAVIELDSGENDEVRILANDFPVAKGAVVVSGSDAERKQARKVLKARGFACLPGTDREGLVESHVDLRLHLVRDGVAGGRAIEDYLRHRVGLYDRQAIEVGLHSSP